MNNESQCVRGLPRFAYLGSRGINMNESKSKTGLRLVKSSDKPVSPESNLIIIDDPWALPNKRFERNTDKTIKLHIIDIDEL